MESVLSPKSEVGIVGGWVGERWFVTGFQWVEAGNAGKHATMHGAALLFFSIYFYIFIYW